MVSIVCAVKNRAPVLRVTLNSWLVSPDVDEIVIVDWSSDASLIPITVLSKKIKLIRVDNEPYFHLAAAFNLAADNATHDIILKLDSDYLLNPFYPGVRVLQPPEKAFFTGNFQHGGPFLSFLNGLVCVRKTDWQRVNGYNELMTGYGADDDDFYLRLIGSGLKRMILNPDPPAVLHIPHENSVRVANYENKNGPENYQKNRMIAESGQYVDRVYSWTYERLNDQVQFARKV
jgi:glycosyltransferase involved in cell wall biosynthesis